MPASRSAPSLSGLLARWLLSPPACRDPLQLRRAVAGKTVLLTGASFGIGREVARLLAQAGARVLLVARSEAPLRELVAELTLLGAEATAYPTDLSQPAQVAALCEQLRASYSHLDAVISNAGRSIRRRAFHAAQKDDLGRSVAVNFTGPAALLLGLLSLYGPGTVLVNVSTVSAKPPGGPRWGAYQGSKAGFDMWFASLSAEVQVRGIRTASVYLPLTRTRMSAPTYGPRMFGLSAREAAESVLYPLVAPGRRPVARVAPWWLTGQEAAALLFPGVFRRAFGLLEGWNRRREGQK